MFSSAGVVCWPGAYFPIPSLFRLCLQIRNPSPASTASPPTVAPAAIPATEPVEDFFFEPLSELLSDPDPGSAVVVVSGGAVEVEDVLGLVVDEADVVVAT